MGELVPFQTSNPVPAFSISDIERVALAIAKGGLFGSKDPNAVLTLCMLAQAEGQHPAVVFRDYHIISGKPAKKAEAMLRDFLSAGGKIEWHELTDAIADATFSHRDGGTVRIAWDHARVVQAQLGGNAMYKKYPRQMLRSRVISEGVRTVCPSATSGLYEVGEVQDIVAERGGREEPTAIEHHEPEPEAEAKPARVKLDGPFTSKSALWAAVKEFDREVRGCGDYDTLLALLSTPDTIALMAQVERDAPQLAHGSEDLPAEFEPLHALVARAKTDLQAAEADDSWKSDVTRAG